MDRGARRRAQVSSVAAELWRHHNRHLERWTASRWHVVLRWVQSSTQSGGSLARWRVTKVAKRSAFVGGRRGIRTKLATPPPPHEERRLNHRRPVPPGFLPATNHQVG